ncbi:MAG: membrane protein insertase YidC [Candidatus Latescibacterota bacterium]|nr:membrane protein insertase YidC [Candidatus Latescibacterota bacterium]
MNDKRTLLGFLLIGLIFVLAPYYYEWMGIGPKPDVEEEALDGREREKTDKKETREMIARELPRSSTVSAQPTVSKNPRSNFETSSQQSFVAQLVKVETPLYNLEFDSKGGLLVSANLKEYSLFGGQPVQLINVNSSALGLSLRHMNGFVEDLTKTEFKPDRDRISVQAEHEALVLSADLGDGRFLAKEFIFYSDSYGFDCVLKYRGFSEDVDAEIGWEGGIPFTEELIEYDLPEMGAIVSFNDERIEVKVDDGEVSSWSDQGYVQWLGIRSKYFLAAIIPEGVNKKRYGGEISGERTGRGPIPNYGFRLSEQLSRDGSWANRVYVGPLDYDNLIRENSGLEQAIDFGWPVINTISKFILIVFKEAYNYIPNYGWIIVLFALVLKVLTYPLTLKSYQSMAKMQEIAPKINALKEKYKNDQQRLSQETMKMYKEEGANPLGGCLPMVLQMPIFFALYQIFSATIELRQSPFALWITDLSVPDVVEVGGIPLRILPLLMALSMFVQQKMTMKDPKQAALVYIMPVVLIFFFWSMASGLVLYWTLFNVFSIAQQHFTGKGASFSNTAG